MEISRIPPMQDALQQIDAAGGQAAQSIEASYGANLSADEHAFQNSLAAAASGPEASGSTTEMAKAMFEPLDNINKEASELAEFAQSALESENTLSPSEMVQLTVKSQQFMFHSQLTANIANRTADGIQQLFRQQS